MEWPDHRNGNLNALGYCWLSDVMHFIVAMVILTSSEQFGSSPITIIFHAVK